MQGNDTPMLPPMHPSGVLPIQAQLMANPGSMVGCPPGLEHSMQVIGNTPMLPPMPSSGVLPNQTQWMANPGSIVGCPPGLEYLAALDQVLVHQQVELLDVMTVIQTRNRYAVKNSLGQQCYFAYEASFFERLQAGNASGFKMHIVDKLGQEVVRASRDFRSCVGCCWCISGETCAYILNVESPAGTPIGRIIQLCSSWKSRYAIQDANNQTVLVIHGPCCVCSGPCCTADVTFNLFTADESSQIGSLARQYSGFAKEMFTNATNFGINFPMDLDVKVKALVLCATFLIDMMFFEQQNNQ